MKLDRFLLEAHASLEDPEDPAEVTLVADAVSVGTNLNGLTWTEEALRKFAHTFVGMPVNVELDEDGEATDHTRSVVGTVTEARYDDARQVVTIRAALWRNYFPHTVTRLKQLHADQKLKVSMEFLAKEVHRNEDGTITPVLGRFSGLAFVRRPADLGQHVLLLASYDDDRRSLNPMENAPMTKLDALIQFMRDTFGYVEASASEEEPEAVEETPASEEETLEASSEEESTMTPEEIEELKASHAQALSELQAQLDTMTAERDALVAEKTAGEAAAAEEARLVELEASRKAELETIAPDVIQKIDAAKLRSMEQTAFDAFKEVLVASAEVKGGIASEAEVETPDDESELTASEKEAEENLPKWREEMLARFGSKPAAAQ